MRKLKARQILFPGYLKLERQWKRYDLFREFLR